MEGRDEQERDSWVEAISLFLIEIRKYKDYVDNKITAQADAAAQATASSVAKSNTRLQRQTSGRRGGVLVTGQGLLPTPGESAAAPSGLMITGTTHGLSGSAMMQSLVADGSLRCGRQKAL